MPTAAIYLQQSNNYAVFLSGESLTDKIVVNALRMKIDPAAGAAPETLNFATGETFEIGKTLLTATADTGNGGADEHYRFNLADVNLIFTANLLLAAGNNKFLGRDFSLAAGYSARLALRLVADAGLNLQPSAMIEFCGQLEFVLADGSVTVATAPLCFQIDVEKLFDGTPSNLNLPSLKIGFPDFGFKLPKLPVTWNFPVLPPFPLALPTQQFSSDGLPIDISWKSAQINEKDGKIAVDIIGLRIAARLHALEGDLHLVWEAGAIKISESYFDLYRPDYQNRLRLQFDQWHFDEDCLLVGWKKGQLNNWLRLLIPDLAEVAETDTDISLRILLDSGDLKEIRLDWQPANAREIQLPGVAVTLPPETLFSLVFYRQNENEKLAFVVTETPTDADHKTITARSTFAFNRDKSERELLNAPASPLIEFKATPNKKISVALLDYPLSGTDSVRFFKQLKTPLEKLGLSDFQAPTPIALPVDPDEPVPPELPAPPSQCPPTAIVLDSLKIGDWSFDLHLPELKLPFLQKGADFQFIQIKPGTPSLQFPEFKCPLEVTVKIADGLEVKSTADVRFNWETFAFRIKDSEGIDFFFTPQNGSKKEFLGLQWEFQPDPKTKKLFTLVTENKNYQLRQATDSVVKVTYPQVGSEAEPLMFELRDFALTPNGVNAKGRVAPMPIKLGGLNTRFRFTEGEFTIEENRIRDFSIAGSGALPPKLVGEATADIALQFRVNQNDKLEIVCGIARLRGKKLLDCKSTRFQFAVDGLGLKFVNDGRYHFYFTITGRAKFVPLPGDYSSGPLSWLPGIEMQMLDCPLTDDVSVISKHVKFLVEMPKKPTFDFLGCFKFELRGIGFVPQAPMFDGDAAMEVSGQLMFADGAGDVVDVRVDFHSLFIGLPKPGDFFPRLHFKGLGVKVRVGDSFALEGEVDFFDDEEIEPGLIAKGFAGRGSLSIQGLPTFTAAFSFIRVSRDGGNNFVRAWFIYVQAEKLSLRIPFINVFIREIGLGFGYRYTLASIKRADELDNPRDLIKELRRLSLSQGELSRRDQWRVVVENPGEDPRWTIAARLMIAQNSAAGGIADWNQEAEKVIPSLFLTDAVLALRSDMTFLMTARAWLNTNYNDYRTKESLRTRPLMSGFVLLSPRQRRFLAHFASNPGAEFGDHPPTLPEFIKQAIRQSYFSATLLIEPGLLHYELGWASQLQWQAKLGPINAEFRGGMIFRISRTDIVYGNSFMARGSLELSAQAGGETVGGRISATAQVAYGARYIGVLGLVRPLERSALYGAVGIEINVNFRVEFWLRIKIGFVKISINLSFGFSIQITALLEIGFTPRNLIGARGRATVSLNIMGRGLHFKINVGVNHDAVEAAYQLTSQFLNIGLEGAEAPPIPGSTAGTLNSATPPPAHLVGAPAAPAFLALSAEQPGAAVDTVAEVALETGADEIVPPAALNEPRVFVAPHYSIYCIPTGEMESYFLLYPNERQLTNGETKQGFLPVPPADGVAVVNDFEWTFPSAVGTTKLEHFNPLTDGWENVDLTKPRKWKADWKQVMGKYEPAKNDAVKDANTNVTLEDLMRKAYIPKPGAEGFYDVVPSDDPQAVTPQDTIEDARVYNPSDAAFEAAVRGASAQFEGSPYFKRDENSFYEAHLANAFLPETTIYSDDGQNSINAENSEQALHLRSTIIAQMLGDLQKQVEGEPGFEQTKSVAFQMGLVFRTKDGIPKWLTDNIAAGKIKQRTKIEADKPDAGASVERDVQIFNTSATNFTDCVPQFQRVRQYTDASTIAITWDLFWTEEIRDLKLTGLSKEQKEPEQFLNYYLIRRRALSGGEREVELKVKPFEVLTLPSVKKAIKNDATGNGEVTIDTASKTIRCETGGFQVFERGTNVKIKIEGATTRIITAKIADTPQAVQPKKLIFASEIPSLMDTDKTIILIGEKLFRLRSRFQFTDNFNNETLEDQAALARAGKSYLYTIIPVDVTGRHSPRPLTVVATRRANFPPSVPADSELQIEYKINYDFQNPNADNDFEPTAEPTLLDPAKSGKITLKWTKPPDIPNQPRVVIENYRLIFRKEKVLPIGSYALDAESEGNRNDGLPSSNARALRTDVVVAFNAKTQVHNSSVELDLQRDLIDTGVFPKDRKWRPESWRIFLQTESESGVLSQLVPVKIVFRFLPGTPQTKEEIKPVERQPALLEWVARPTDLRMLAPEDEKADVDFATFPMPQIIEAAGAAKINAAAQSITMSSKDLSVFESGARVFVSGAATAANNGLKKVQAATKDVLSFAPGSFAQDEESKLTLTRKTEALKDSIEKLLGFLKHPDDLRAVRLRWNQSPSGRRDFPVNLQAGYQVLEFDLDAHTTEVLDNPPLDFLEKLRRVQDVELLSANAQTLTPNTATVANQWEAWYGSVVRRRRLRLQTDEIANVPPKFSKARLSPWFSWRDSYLEWAPDDLEIKDDKPRKAVNIVTVNVKIDEKKQALFRTEDWQGVNAGDFVRIVGANNPANNGLKQISPIQTSPNEPVDTKRLLFVPGSFVKEEKPGEFQKITLDLKPATVLHPFLQVLKKALDGLKLDGEEIAVETNPLPPVKLDNLELLQKQLSPQQDPYGWNVLKLLGLSISFTLRIERTGEVLKPEKAQALVSRKLDELRATGVLTPEIARHLFIEFLFQPAKSTKLESETGAPKKEDLLSLMQISLRPVARRYFRYWVFKTRNKEVVKVKLKAKTKCEIIELTRNASRELFTNEESAEKERSYEVVPPASGEAILLFRSTDAPTVNDRTPQEFGLTDWLSLNFDALPDEWRDIFEERSLWSNQAAPAAAWQRFGVYLTRLNSLDDAAKIELPTVSEKIDALFPWLNRFFDASGDYVKDDASEVPAHTGGDISVASAYLRTPSPAMLTPDAAGRLTYYHRIEDQWAHVYRYYFLPQNRYDRLWMALAKVDALFPVKKPAVNVWFKPPDEETGGLDVVLDRIKEVAAPLVLYSGRLDRKLPDAQLPHPGKIWEILIAKHPEQALVERNRTLVRQLDYRQTAHTLLRRFGFLPALSALKSELRKHGNQILDKLEYTPAATVKQLPNKIEKPTHLDAENPGALDANARLSLDLPSRLGVFAKDAIALQYEALPYFYEHMLMVVAQTSTQVSSVTTVVQRDFEYVSPTPKAESEAFDLAGGERALRLKITLKNYWSCLPPDVQNRWAEENPGIGDILKLAAVPDTDVIYQIVLAGAVGNNNEQDAFFNTEAQAEFFYDPPENLDRVGVPRVETYYKAREFGGEFKAEALLVEAPQVFSPNIEFALLVSLRKTNRLKLPNAGNIVLPTGDFNLEQILDKLRRVFPTLGKLLAANAPPDEIKYVLRHYKAVAVVSAEPITSPPVLVGKIVYLTRNGEVLLAARTTLTKSECELLMTLFPLPADRAAVERFCRDVEDRQNFDEFFRDWASEQAIGSRRDFGAETNRIEFPAPMSCVLALDAETADRESMRRELTTLLQTSPPLDNSFANAVRQLIEQLATADETQTFFRAEACVGLEQIREVASDTVFTLDAANRKLTWRGAIRPLQRDAVERWAEISDFRQTFRSLLDTADGKVLQFKFASPEPLLPADSPIPPILQSRMKIVPSSEVGFREVVWTGLNLDADEERALIDIRDLFGGAIPELLVALTLDTAAHRASIEVPIREDFWHLRPTPATLSALLKPHLLIGNGQIRYYGWMTRSEARKLIDLQALNPYNQRAVRRLFRDSLERGMRGSKLFISARRGSAEISELKQIGKAE